MNNDIIQILIGVLNSVTGDAVKAMAKKCGKELLDIHKDRKKGKRNQARHASGKPGHKAKRSKHAAS